MKRIINGIKILTVEEHRKALMEAGETMVAGYIANKQNKPNANLIVLEVASKFAQLDTNYELLFRAQTFDNKKGGKN